VNREDAAEILERENARRPIVVSKYEPWWNAALSWPIPVW